MRNTLLPLSSNVFGQEEVIAIKQCLDSGWLSSGPEVSKLEEEIAHLVGMPNVLAANSCTSAIDLALTASKLSPGDGVLIPSITYASTLQTILHRKLQPLFLDVDPHTLNLAPPENTPKNARALIVTHLHGYPADLNAITSYCKKHSLILIEDCAHAIGSYYKGRPLGSFGDFSAFSFYPSKCIASAEGGILCYKNKNLKPTLEQLRYHGIKHSAWDRKSSESSLHWEVVGPGHKYNMTDLQACIIRCQLKKLDLFRKQRLELVKCYHEELRDVAEIQLPPKAEDVCWYVFGIQLKTEMLRISRDRLAEALRRENIGVGFHFIPIHTHPYFKDILPQQSLPITENAGKRILSLPLHCSMESSDVLEVCNTLKRLILHHG